MVALGSVSSHSIEPWIQFSSSDGRKQILIDRVHAAYQKYMEGSAGRSEYFASLSELSKTFLNRQIEAFDSDDFFKQAEKILNGLAFKRFPSSRLMLRDPALRYQQALKTWEEMGTIEGLRDLANAHDAFVKAYIPIFQHATRLKPGMIRWNFPQTVLLFNSALMKNLKNDFNLWAERVRSSDVSLMVRLPLLAVYEWISNGQYAKPEIFSREAFALREAFKRLEPQEQEALYSKLAEGETALQSGEGQALYLAIAAFASSFQRGLEAEEYNAIAQTLVRDWVKILAVAEAIEFTEIPESDLDFMKLFLKTWIQRGDFKEETLPDAILYHLPSKRAVLSLKNNCSDISVSNAAELLLAHNLFNPKESIEAALGLAQLTQSRSSTKF